MKKYVNVTFARMDIYFKGEYYDSIKMVLSKVFDLSFEENVHIRESEINRVKELLRVKYARKIARYEYQLFLVVESKGIS